MSIKRQSYKYLKVNNSIDVGEDECELLINNEECREESGNKAINGDQDNSIKNSKNLSLKEFANKIIMKTKSAETGYPSPRDESSNWFDDIKARMSKKSPGSNKPTPSTSLKPSPNDIVVNDDEEFVDIMEPCPSYQSSKSVPKEKHNRIYNKESCDNPGDKSTTENILEIDAASNTPNQSIWKKFSNVMTSTNKSVRRRKAKIPINHSSNFETASIQTIFNESDNQSYKSSGKSVTIWWKIMRHIIKNFQILLPFDFNLPWKVIACSSLAALLSKYFQHSQRNSIYVPLSFMGGVLFGLVLSTVFFIILVICFLLNMIPVSQKQGEESEHSCQVENTTSIERIGTNESNYLGQSVSETGEYNDIDVQINQTELDTTIDKTTSEFSSFEELDLDRSNRLDSSYKNMVLLEEDNYSGWVIEFVGNYEMRNKSNVKVKNLYMKLEKKMLHLCKPKNDKDVDSSVDPVFSQQKSYDLDKSRKFVVNLLLPSIVKNRQRLIWSKKYPIKLEMIVPKNSDVKTVDMPYVEEKVIITFFAKSCREKEEWFRRLKRSMDTRKVGQEERTLSPFPVASINYKRPSLLSETSDDESSRTSPSTASKEETNKLLKSFLNNLRNDSSGSNLNLDPNQELIRTKSCEFLQPSEESQPSPTHSKSFREQSDSSHEDTKGNWDSTLTKETAEIYNNAIELSDMKKINSSLNYVEYIRKILETEQEVSRNSSWFNAITSRIFFDVFSHQYWSIWFKRKIQRKLYRIRLPFFMETLTLTEIDLGKNPPKFLDVLSHSFDSSGLSVIFDMSYSGGLTMTFETKLNLLKIKNEQSNSTLTNQMTYDSSATGSPSSTSNSSYNQKNTNVTGDTSSESSQKVFFGSTLNNHNSGESSESSNSESEYSSASYDGVDSNEISDWEDYGAEKTRQNIVKFVDRIASSRYFQQATENKYIKRKLQDISNCPLVLKVEIQSLNGHMILNIPPPTTDRLWYGFEQNAKLILKAHPKMGDRVVNFPHVTDWIERKLVEEFKKVLVTPNMEDIVLPVLKSDHLLYVSTTK